MDSFLLRLPLVVEVLSPVGDGGDVVEVCTRICIGNPIV
jgi:hypothetical protein